MGDNADNTTFLLQLTASIYYNEAAIGKGEEEGEQECDGAGFEGAFLPSSLSLSLLSCLPFQSINQATS